MLRVVICPINQNLEEGIIMSNKNSDKKSLAILALPIGISLGISIGMIFGSVAGNVPMGLLFGLICQKNESDYGEGSSWFK